MALGTLGDGRCLHMLALEDDGKRVHVLALGG
jgi:hypothetical protein